MENKELFDRLTDLALSLGAFRASVIPVEDMETDASFRDMCAANVCGNYGRNWMCPPDAGDIHDLMAALKTYSYALVYQTVSELEDSYDFEGMMDAGVAHNKLMIQLREKLNVGERCVARPVMLRRATYNQELAKYSMLLEIGTAANSPKEATRAAVLVGNALADLIQEP